MNSYLPKGAPLFLLWLILQVFGILLIGWMIYHTHGRNTLPKNQQQSQIALAVGSPDLPFLEKLGLSPE
jgi:hypothetical protein